ncbi:glycosyltransferase family 2 protein [Flavobacterium capsici]|uniref:Glycosyltransferase family 2 protein n=1 Tax=Flavobacterium capsici TaxID=3075618 RepID=A0AA96J4U2_9FLAO|nr:MULTISPECIES: glycosyltransferase family 2 protein [unclassified Flavobacterium]WNM20345.1 glycosyltransferase family 2 protein [Flavobacterium sp. PMR2A8]WNM21735.1 glycosyltransferase family 2 protein [Flavobacterium sp. PMTSA4]
MTLSVIFSTYNSEEWLEKVVWGFSVQTFKDFEIIIADDGSRESTKQLIDRLRGEIEIPIIHVWQEDNGFQKSQILNKAILASTSDYLIFTDGDCIPREDFVEVHNKYREQGYFLSGGYFKLPMDISKAITKDDIINQRCFDINWLKEKGLPSSYKNIKFTSKGIISKILNAITPTNASWNGHNASGWKKDLMEVNGFNQEMQYGGQDRELGERMFNKGLKSKQIRYSAICVHLDHKRGYVNEETWKKNYSIRENTKKNKVIKTPIGIDSNK